MASKWYLIYMLIHGAAYNKDNFRSLHIHKLYLHTILSTRPILGIKNNLQVPLTPSQ
jgi:hypothetical protein